jgi:hypothetical protein
MEEFRDPLASGGAYRPLNRRSLPGPRPGLREPAGGDLALGAWGLFLCAIFTAVGLPPGLKVGQVMEAAIHLDSRDRPGPRLPPALEPP